MLLSQQNITSYGKLFDSRASAPRKKTNSIRWLAIEMHILPQLSMNGIYWFFIGCLSFTLLFVNWMPPYAIDTGGKMDAQVADQRGKLPAYIPWLCLAAIFVTYINIGAYWTYIELASLDAGVPDEWIGSVLVWASFLSIVGCAFATVISNRFGLARPLVAALISMAIIVGMLIYFLMHSRLRAVSPTLAKTAGTAVPVSP